MILNMMNKYDIKYDNHILIKLYVKLEVGNRLPCIILSEQLFLLYIFFNDNLLLTFSVPLNEVLI